MTTIFPRRLMFTKYFPPHSKDLNKRLNYLKLKKVFNKEASVFVSRLMERDLGNKI